MPTPNKYHSSGRLYTAKEYRDRKHALRPTYLVAHPMPGVSLIPDKPYNIGRNAKKRAVRAHGFKSLKQWLRTNDTY